MLEFIQRFWLQTLFSFIVTALGVSMKWGFKSMQNEYYKREKMILEDRAEQALIKKGVLSILHDRVYQACQYHLSRGYISIKDFQNLKYLYEGYSGLGGNGTCEILYNRCSALPLEVGGEKDVYTATQEVQI